jgi:hypothetical protein
MSAARPRRARKRPLASRKDRPAVRGQFSSTSGRGHAVPARELARDRLVDGDDAVRAADEEGLQPSQRPAGPRAQPADLGEELVRVVDDAPPAQAAGGPRHGQGHEIVRVVHVRPQAIASSEGAQRIVEHRETLGRGGEPPAHDPEPALALESSRERIAAQAQDGEAVERFLPRL